MYQVVVGDYDRTSIEGTEQTIDVEEVRLVCIHYINYSILYTPPSYSYRMIILKTWVFYNVIRGCFCWIFKLFVVNLCHAE